MTQGFTRRPLSRRGFFKLMRLTLGGIFLCVAVSVSFNTWLFWSSDPPSFRRAMICATVLPLLLAGPLFIFISLKLRQLSQLNRELHYSATHDALTMILNRGAFIGEVNARMEILSQVEGGRGALLLIDADFFKSINDRFGHSMGDETLRQISARLMAMTRAEDVVGRLGGEEFAVFLPGAGQHLAKGTAERLRAVVADMQLQTPGGETLAASISIGGIAFRDPISVDEMFQRADRKLYDAKANGRNRVEMEEFNARRYGAAA